MGPGGLSGTKQGARIRFSAGKHTVIDGPFTESKELVAGYAILKLPSKGAAIEWAIRLGQIVKVNEVEVRQLHEWCPERSGYGAGQTGAGVALIFIYLKGDN